MPWVWLAAAGVFEIAFATFLKASDGFTRPLYILLFTVFAALSLWCLTVALREIPLGTAYAIWTGIGAAGTALVGIGVYGEPATAARLFFLVMLIGAIAGLRWTAPAL